jgi:hypothetical protein
MVSMSITTTTTVVGVERLLQKLEHRVALLFFVYGPNK